MLLHLTNKVIKRGQTKSNKTLTKTTRETLA